MHIYSFYCFFRFNIFNIFKNSGRHNIARIRMRPPRRLRRGGRTVKKKERTLTMQGYAPRHPAASKPRQGERNSVTQSGNGGEEGAHTLRCCTVDGRVLPQRRRYDLRPVERGGHFRVHCVQVLLPELHHPTRKHDGGNIQQLYNVADLFAEAMRRFVDIAARRLILGAPLLISDAEQPLVDPV